MKARQMSSTCTTGRQGVPSLRIKIRPLVQAEATGQLELRLQALVVEVELVHLRVGDVVLVDGLELAGPDLVPLRLQQQGTAPVGDAATVVRIDAWKEGRHALDRLAVVA